MCGDGANDCAALNEADVGLSLSLAEASIAAPFTTSVFEISSLIALLCEGRCALASSYQNFKYMAMYSWIQFISSLLISNLGAYLADFQFLCTDAITVLPLVALMLLSRPEETLSIKKPAKRLICVRTFVSILLQFAISFIFLWFALEWVQKQSF